MYETLSDKEVLCWLQATEDKIKQLNEDLKNLREENEKRKTIALGKPLDISGVGRFTASVRCNDTQAHSFYDDYEQDVCTFYSLESAKEFSKFLIHLSGALKSNFYGRPIDPKVIALLLPQGTYIAQDEDRVWRWFKTQPTCYLESGTFEIEDGNWSRLPFNMSTTDDWTCTLIKCGLPNGSKEFSRQPVEISEIFELKSCLNWIAAGLKCKDPELTKEEILKMITKTMKNIGNFKLLSAS